LDDLPTLFEEVSSISACCLTSVLPGSFTLDLPGLTSGLTWGLASGLAWVLAWGLTLDLSGLT
jgi:hypothetical protein